ncbi:conserved hypothetical protein [Culex quinquefasciatus]|uniref:Uncharacterized protein n=1 Tax=Culex quinquefasciatus TaxID=7176 RepID=B0X233_CULQU|nr:conserved hypothetical protein [Culex quinquefasciatus]|eukprot:XP_001863705.1 conserved hypothetical protein [Culex quinquefasciatus]
MDNNTVVSLYDITKQKHYSENELKRKWGLLATAEFLLLFRALTIFGAGALIVGRVNYWGFVLLAGKGRDGDCTDELDKASYADIVLKLKQKLDKTEPDLVQRFRFSQRNQQPDESNEDFVQSVKLQAEFCGFGAFKDVAIMDRVLAGLLDGNLKENLLKEDGLTLDKMDKFITTWNIAKQNNKFITFKRQQHKDKGLHGTEITDKMMGCNGKIIQKGKTIQDFSLI